ncbi:uncharacterized protein N7473_001158 [Penicillium subrubescens]|uniref:uncharacterized protein n=1 Tax=Penicillium subrubescens TaxID=1316194 RepID=UPI002545B6C6|nr:uncharacterized protein N7473_001158 [Penicillium subrubescens]KAJ5911855.1 hypothetical protein N7473_001158 [Penicillium subrubescens]
MSTTMFTNHYDVLGVSRHASIEEIKVSWRKFALKYHPDKTRGAKTYTEMFQKGQEAIEILRDPSRRYKYDKELEAHSSHPWVSSTGDHPPPQTSSVDSQSMNSHYHHRNWTGHQNRQNGANQKPQNEPYKEEIRAQASRDVRNSAASFNKAGKGSSLEQNLATYPNDKGVMGDTSTLHYKSTDHAISFYTCGLRGDSDINHQVCTAASSCSSNGTSSELGGVLLADFETPNDDEKTYTPDTLRSSPPVPKCDLAIPSSSFNSVNPDQFAGGSHNPVINNETQWPLRAFIPYDKAKLDDPRGRYTVDDMYDELHGLVMESVYSWLKTTDLAGSNTSLNTAADAGSTCPHLGLWHKEIGHSNVTIAISGSPFHLDLPGLRSEEMFTKQVRGLLLR